MKSRFTGKRLFGYDAESYEKEAIKMIEDAMLDGDLLTACNISQEKINILDEILSQENIDLANLVEHCPQEFKADCILDERTILATFDKIIRLEGQRHTLTSYCLEELEREKNLFLTLIGEDWEKSIKLDLKEQAFNMRECNEALDDEELKFNDLEEFILYESQLVYKIGNDFYDFSLL